MKRILVIGAASVDILADAKLTPHDSNPGKVDLAFGGVGKNVAEDLRNLGADVSFLTFMGDDRFAFLIEDHLNQIGFASLVVMKVAKMRSPLYVAIHDDLGQLVVGVNDFSGVEARMPNELESYLPFIRTFDILVVEANLPEAVLSYLGEAARDKILIADAVSGPKSVRLLPILKRLTLLKANRTELEELALRDGGSRIEAASMLMASGLRNLIVTEGKHPVLYHTASGFREEPVPKSDRIVSTNGAGDALLAGVVFAIADGRTLQEAVKLGIRAAGLTMQVKEACHPHLSIILKESQRGEGI